jgi:hypothetical protein
MNVEAVSEETKAKYGADTGIYDISPANRFGEPVVSVSCITRADAERLAALIDDPYKGCHIHLRAPMWGVGELVPENDRAFKAMLHKRDNVTYGTDGNRELQAFIRRAIEEDSRVWESWPAQERTRWIASRIRNARKTNPSFANCGDKFLGG